MKFNYLFTPAFSKTDFSYRAPLCGRRRLREIERFIYTLVTKELLLIGKSSLLHLMVSLFSKILNASPSLRAPSRLTLTPHSLELTPIRLMSTQRLFQLKLDPLSGNFEWMVIDEDENSLEPSQEPLLATTSYLDMLNDSYRNKAYRLAIDKTVIKPCRVLDIGYRLLPYVQEK